jgi:trimeric autotransporter adhesin
VYTVELDAAHVAAQYSLGSSDTPNVPPIASFTATVDPVGGLNAAFDATATVDPDGTIASYRWDFGDGTPAVTVATPVTNHVYAAGTYTATLTVTDDEGAADVRTATVVAPGANSAPTATFSAGIVGRNVTFDAAGSTDPNGSIVQYAWNFGDGATGTTTTPSAQHTYAAPGTYLVTLTVTDDRGATGVVTHNVSANDLAVAPPPPASVLAADAFGRTVANGLGAADTGGTWTVTGTTSNYAVTGTAGTLRMAAAASGPIARLDAVSAVNTNTSVEVAFDKQATGGGIYFTTVGRRVGASEYRGTARVQANGTVQALVVRRLGTTDTNLAVVNAVPGITLVAGQSLSSRFEVTGTSPTTLRLKLWLTGTPEPTTWTATATDSDASLQASGSIGVNTYLSGSATNAPIVATIDNLRSIDPLAPTTAPPTARFAIGSNGLTTTLDAGISVDDGSIVGWSWNFGDGTTATVGPTTSHTYAAPGTYAVQLTVTDDQGLTGQTTLNVSAG